MKVPPGLRRTAAIVAALAVAVVVVRSAAVQAFAERDPRTAEAIWSGHPSAAIGLASIEIAKAAGAGKPIGDDAFETLSLAAAKAPLEPQPFIVRGIRLQLEGREDEAEGAFAAASWRNPRSIPARYFLANVRLSQGDVEGLREVAALTRLSPEGLITSTPYLAAFARQKQALEPMRALFAANPNIRSAVLSNLAQDPANLSLVLQLGGSGDVTNAPWLAAMIRTLVDHRQYASARALWARTAGIDRSATHGLVFDANFSDSASIPPFNWELTSSTLGLAERRSGRLQAIYYGQEDGPLARQLLLLGPGRYRFDAPAKGAAEGSDGSSLLWTIRCADPKGNEALASAPASAGGLIFVVPASCAAQWLELVGRSSDTGREIEKTIGPVSLSRAGGE